VGKSFIVGSGISNLRLSRVYMLMPGPFFFGYYWNDIYDILFEEFKYDCFKASFWQLRRVLERTSFAVD
jgi:hypothetical protein